VVGVVDDGVQRLAGALAADLPEREDGLGAHLRVPVAVFDDRQQRILDLLPINLGEARRGELPEHLVVLAQRRDEGVDDATAFLLAGDAAEQPGCVSPLGALVLSSRISTSGTTTLASSVWESFSTTVSRISWLRSVGTFDSSSTSEYTAVRRTVGESSLSAATR